MNQSSYFHKGIVLAGLREVLLISTPRDIAGFERLLGDNIFYGQGFQGMLERVVRRHEDRQDDFYRMD